MVKNPTGVITRARSSRAEQTQVICFLVLAGYHVPNRVYSNPCPRVSQTLPSLTMTHLSLLLAPDTLFVPGFVRFRRSQPIASATSANSSSLNHLQVFKTWFFPQHSPKDFHPASGRVENIASVIVHIVRRLSAVCQTLGLDSTRLEESMESSSRSRKHVFVEDETKVPFSGWPGYHRVVEGYQRRPKLRVTRFRMR
jgi:hypothetical protein